jgi:hypothetical protein
MELDKLDKTSDKNLEEIPDSIDFNKVLDHVGQVRYLF